MKLNVAGKPFDVPGDYLSGPRAGMLRRLTDGTIGSTRDAEGRLRVDADPKTFRHVMWYWRHGKVPNYLAPPDRDMLAVDAEYLGLFELSGGLRLQKLEAEAPLSVVHQLRFADGLFDAGQELRAVNVAARARSSTNPSHARVISMHYDAALRTHPMCPWRQLHAPSFFPAYDDSPLRDPVSPVEASVRARIMLQYKRPAEAKQLAQRVLTFSPRLAEAKIIYIQALLELGDIDAAERELLLHEDHASVYYAIAIALCKAARGDRDPALIAFSAALQRCPRSVAAHVERALMLLQFGQAGRASVDFARLATIAPHAAQQYAEAGARHHADGDFVAAERCLLVATRIRPQVAEWHAVMGENYLATYRGEASVQSLELATQLQPLNARFQYLLSCALDYMEQTDRALQAIERANALEAGNAQYLQHLGDLSHQAGDLSTAVSAYGRVCALVPREFDSRVRLAQCLIESGRHADARPVCQDALRQGAVSTEMAETVRDLGDCLMAVGDYANALGAYTKSQQVGPESYDCSAKIASAHERLGGSVGKSAGPSRKRTSGF